MTLDDVRDLGASWARHPPTHVAVRRVEDLFRGALGALGLEPEPSDTPRAPPAPVSEADLRAEVAMINAGM